MQSSSQDSSASTAVAIEPDKKSETKIPPEIDKNQPVTYESLLAGGPAEINGKNIGQIFLASPLYAPIEGLPEDLWRNNDCLV